MGSNVVMSSFSPAGIRPCATAAGGGGRVSPARAAGGSWWTPMFGWAAEADYIDGETVAKEELVEERRRRRFSGLTEEKAKELRMRTMETETFHDKMYHSAIASRLASDLPRRTHD